MDESKTLVREPSCLRAVIIGNSDYNEMTELKNLPQVKNDLEEVK
jgi:hypothetical protein